MVIKSNATKKIGERERERERERRRERERERGFRRARDMKERL